MESAQVFWSEAGINFDEDPEFDIDRREVHTGLLTDDAEYATGDGPVVVEDLTGRIYLPDDLRPDTVLFIESAAGAMPPIAEAARQAGYHVAHAEDSGRIELTGRPEEEIEPPDPHTEEA
jgi:hypothetical protein